MDQEPQELSLHFQRIEKYPGYKEMNREWRKTSYYKNLDKEREAARVRYYTKRGLEAPPRKN